MRRRVSVLLAAVIVLSALVLGSRFIADLAYEPGYCIITSTEGPLATITVRRKRFAFLPGDEFVAMEPVSPPDGDWSKLTYNVFHAPLGSSSDVVGEIIFEPSR